MCWATNVIGEQRHPCVFYIVPAGRPDPVTDCSATNLTSDLVQVICRQGYDGGLPQHFQVEVMDLLTGRKISNRTEKSLDDVIVRNLEPARKYQLTFWAVNIKGRSDPAILYVNTRDQTINADKDRNSEPIGKWIKPAINFNCQLKKKGFVNGMAGKTKQIEDIHDE